MSDKNCCGACGYPIHATKDKACDWCRQSADRIEALTYAHDTMVHLWAKEAAEKQVALGRIEELTAERDESVQLLKTLSCTNADLARDLYRTKLLLKKARSNLMEIFRIVPMHAAGDIARALLAEIEGSNAP
jgi:hypothetical protein